MQITQTAPRPSTNTPIRKNIWNRFMDAPTHWFFFAPVIVGTLLTAFRPTIERHSTVARYGCEKPSIVVCQAEKAAEDLYYHVVRNTDGSVRVPETLRNCKAGVRSAITRLNRVENEKEQGDRLLAFISVRGQLMEGLAHGQLCAKAPHMESIEGREIDRELVVPDAMLRGHAMAITKRMPR